MIDVGHQSSLLMAADNTWTGISVSGEARAHLGHQYVTVTNNIQVTASLARNVYEACISTTNFRSLANDVASFRSLLDFTMEKIKASDLMHNDAQRIITIVKGCSECLQEVESSISRFNNMPIQSQWTWERMEMGATELAELRGRLGTSISLLGSLNAHLATSSQEAVQAMLRKYIEEIRTGRREGSIISTDSIDSLSPDEKEAWRGVRKELEDVGITPELFTRHSAWIKKTLSDASQSGSLQEQPLAAQQFAVQDNSTSDQVTLTNPMVSVTTADPRQSFKESTNAWDDIPEIERYIGALQNSHQTPASNILQLVPLPQAPSDHSSQSKLYHESVKVTAIFEGHTAEVLAVAFSPDGKLIASASADKTVKLWDPATGAVHATLESHSAWVNTVVFSPDGKLIVSVPNENTVRLWDTGTGAVHAILKGHSNWVKSVAFSPDSKLIASASIDDTVRLWDPATGAALVTLKGHAAGVLTIAFSPDGKLIASASKDRTVRLWDTGTRAVHAILKGHSGTVQAVAFSLDGKLVASASDDETVRLWDTATGALLTILEGHSSEVDTVVFSPDDKLIVSVSDDKTARLWDTGTGSVHAILKGHSSLIVSVAFSPDSKLIASASMDDTIRLWDTVTGAVYAILEGHSDWVWQAVFSPDGKLIASASDDATVRLWDVTTTNDAL